MSVPVTVDELLHDNTETITVQVVSSSTATEYVDATNPNDFRIVTKSVGFAPGGAKTQNLSVTINDDDVQEGAEFIQLRFEPASSDSTITTNYQRNNQARLTIPANDAPAQAPTNLVVSPADTRLDLTWTAPSGTQTGYDVHYTSAASGTVANDAAVQSGAASAGWVAVARGTENTPPTASQAISSLTNNTLYRVRVRATEGNVVGAWAFGTGTPAPITGPGVPRNVQIVPGNNRVTLTWQAPASWGTYAANAFIIQEFVTDTDGGEVFTRHTSATSRTIQRGAHGSGYYASNGQTETWKIRTRSLKSGSDSSDAANYRWSAWVEVTVTVGTPGLPTGLTATPGDQKLDLAWTAPSGNSSAVTGYDVHYTSAAAGTVSNSATASGSDPSAAWVDASHSGTTAAQTIASLANDGTTYRWRVRAANGRGSGPWAFGTGQTPIPVSLSVTPVTVNEGESVSVTATRTVAGPAVTIPVTVSTSGANTAEPGDVGALTGIAIAAGATSTTVTLVAEHDADTLDETFTVLLGSLPNTHVPGSTTSVQVTITDDDMPTVSLSVEPVRPDGGGVRRCDGDAVESDLERGGDSADGDPGHGGVGRPRRAGLDRRRRGPDHGHGDDHDGARRGPRGRDLHGVAGLDPAGGGARGQPGLGGADDRRRRGERQGVVRREHDDALRERPEAVPAGARPVAAARQHLPLDQADRGPRDGGAPRPRLALFRVDQHPVQHRVLRADPVRHPGETGRPARPSSSSR